MVDEEKKYSLELNLTSMALIASANRKLEKRIFNLLKEIVDSDVKENRSRGALIVLGEFVRFDYRVPGMKQIRSNPLTGTALYVNDADIKEKLDELLREDGAMVIDATGQIMAAQVYLQVDHADVDVEEECSTRHISAASFSMNDHIIACFTISEQTGKVRKYVKGEQKYVYDPHEEVKEEDEDIV